MGIGSARPLVDAGVPCDLALRINGNIVQRPSVLGNVVAVGYAFAERFQNGLSEGGKLLGRRCAIKPCLCPACFPDPAVFLTGFAICRGAHNVPGNFSIQCA